MTQNGTLQLTSNEGASAKSQRPTAGNATKAEAAVPVLVIEDDETLAMTLRYRLEKEGYRVTVAHDGIEGLRAARFLRPELVLLDLMLPNVSGRDVCRQLRSWTDAPILILTALDREEDVLSAFQAGADDYVTKPFSFAQLMARVQALLRRARGTKPEPDVIVAEGLVVRPREFRAQFHGRELKLPPKEFKLLTALVREPGKVFSRAELLDLIWGEDIVVDPRNVDVHIRWIRAQLEGEPDGSYLIETVHGVGYRFAGVLDGDPGEQFKEGKVL